MLEKALEILNIFYENKYEAYIVGGFVRDYIIGKESNDVDICTNATPMEIKRIFKDVKLPTNEYGSVHLLYKKVRFEITTYRIEIEYKDNRKPSKIMYVNDLELDLKRRDFTMNTICMDKNGKIVDKFSSLKDIKNKTIKCVLNADDKLSEDSLRILRAIRFSTELNFKLDSEIDKAILKYGYLLENLSFYRKKEELNKIFLSSNSLIGINLLRKYNLDSYLGINLNKTIVNVNDLIGMWAQVDPSSNYDFSNNEKNYIIQIKRLIEKKEITNLDLFKNGNYICYIASKIINNGEEDNIEERYNKLKIKKISDIEFSINDIIHILKIKDKKSIKTIIDDLVDKILSDNLINDSDIIKKYLIDTYGIGML